MLKKNRSAKNQTMSCKKLNLLEIDRCLEIKRYFKQSRFAQNKNKCIEKNDI